MSDPFDADTRAAIESSRRHFAGDHSTCDLATPSHAGMEPWERDLWAQAGGLVPVRQWQATLYRDGAVMTLGVPAVSEDAAIAEARARSGWDRARVAVSLIRSPSERRPPL